MPDNASYPPRPIQQVMVSSTFTDLKEHRAALIGAINSHGLHPKVMEHDSARLVDVIDSSLQMVRESSAYILLISQKYGQTPECPKRNPNKLSITELEFNEAQRLERPTLLFIMGDDHGIKKADIEKDPEKEIKLNAFRERAKNASAGSAVHRVYKVFNSLEEFKDGMNSPLDELGQYLASTPVPSAPAKAEPAFGPQATTIPTPPAFYAEPDYIGSHQFVGRQAELDALSDWANHSDPTNLLLFEAIGGNGKSMLTWEWTIWHSTKGRAGGDAWAGRFWYSFYEKGAIMADFCRRALAYMTGKPLEEFAKKKTSFLVTDLLAQLHARPWLLILDGLERVLVAYHRIDAAEVPDEEANTPTDKILSRNPCDAIRDEDNDLLRALAACAPSKILVSSRLTPRILLNSAGQPIQGAKRITLPGLRPPDAEALLRQCGITGDSIAIRDYLRQNCDNHPLVIGILAGLINKPGSNRGNFDAWSTDTSGGAALDLGKLDLIQRRNHILRAAIEALPDSSRRLLSTLALLSESVDYETLKALNPHLPPEPERVAKPRMPRQNSNWEAMSKIEKTAVQLEYAIALQEWKSRELEAIARLQSEEYRQASKKLPDTVKELEQRGLLQFDSQTRRYDIHPVVRSVASGQLSRIDQVQYGQRVIDHFSQQARNPYEMARTLDDLRIGLHVVRVLFKIGKPIDAIRELKAGLMDALLYNVEDYVESLSLLRPLFDSGWGRRTRDPDRAWLCQKAAIALKNSGELDQSIEAYQASISPSLEHARWYLVRAGISGLGACFYHQNKLAQSAHCYRLALDFSEAFCEARKDDFMIVLGRNGWFKVLSTLGLWEEGNEMLFLRDSVRFVPTNDQQRSFVSRMALDLALFRLGDGSLNEGLLTEIHGRAVGSGSRGVLREFHRLRGSWRLEQHDYPQAATSFQEAVSMARERRLVDEHSEIGLALAKCHLGLLTGDDARSEAERLAQLRQPAHRYLAMLWLAIGDGDRARHHALAAYRWAWADGEPYVHRYELTKTTELLQEMKVEVPVLPPYDPTKNVPFPWEADVRTAMMKLRMEKEAKKKAK